MRWALLTGGIPHAELTAVMLFALARPCSSSDVAAKSPVVLEIFGISQIVVHQAECIVMRKMTVSEEQDGAKIAQKER
jgi:hypothetical protein